MRETEIINCYQTCKLEYIFSRTILLQQTFFFQTVAFASGVILSTSLPIKCGPSQYTVFDPQNEEKIVMCQDCPKCPRGEGAPVQCGSRVPNGTSTQCKACELGKSFSNTTDSSTCLSCHECGKKTVLQQCSLTENRKCGDCLEKHFLEPHLNDCVECYTCCSDIPENERMGQCGKVLGLPNSEWCEANEKNKLCARLNATKNNKANETLSSTSTGVDKTLSTTGSFVEPSGGKYSTISRNSTDLVTPGEPSGKSYAVQTGIAISFSVLALLVIVGFIIYKRWFSTQTSSSNRNVRYLGVETGIDNYCKNCYFNNESLNLNEQEIHLNHVEKKKTCHLH